MLYFSGRNSGSELYRMIRSDKVARIANGIYTSDLDTPVETQVRNNIVDILGHLGVNGILAYRSAVEFPDFGEDEMVISGTRKRDIVMPGIVIHVYAANRRDLSTQFCHKLNGARFSTGLYLPLAERAVLENLSTARSEEKKSNRDMACKLLIDIARKNPETVLDRMETVAHALGRTETMDEVVLLVDQWRRSSGPARRRNSGLAAT